MPAAGWLSSMTPKTPERNHNHTPIPRCPAQLSDTLFLTDGGIETTLIFHNGIDLPDFAAFVLLRRQDCRKTLEDYYKTYASIAKEHETGFILESATWRPCFMRAKSVDAGQKSD